MDRLTTLARRMGSRRTANRAKIERMKHSLPLLLFLCCAGCAAPSSTKLSFRTPPGSELTFQKDALVAGRVTFPENLELEQFVAPGGEARREVSGTLRVSELVEREAIPSTARSLLVESEGGVDVKVKGFYRVYERAVSSEEALNTYAVDVSRQQLQRLLSGKATAVEVEDGGSEVFELILGLDD